MSSPGLSKGGRAIFAQARQQLLDGVKDEGHGEEPADPAQHQVTSHGKLPVVAANDIQGRANPQRLRLGVEGRLIQLMTSETR